MQGATTLGCPRVLNFPVIIFFAVLGLSFTILLWFCFSISRRAA